MPDLHVVAAGSLLELAVAEIPSLGVGRLTSLHLYPLTFREYLAALGEEALSRVVDEADPDHPLDEPFHRRLVDHVKGYQLVGGMPAVVDAYARTRDLAACFRIQDDLITSFQDDFAKFKYSSVGSGSSTQVLKDALHLLVQVGLVTRVVRTQARSIPLGAQVDETKFKAMLFDVGIHQRLLGLDVPEYLTSSDLELVNRGGVAEVFTGLELVGNHPAQTRPMLHYWYREARGGNAEVDFVIQQGAGIVPVEVKAGTRGLMQSMYRFMDERGLRRGVRVALEHFARYDFVESDNPPRGRIPMCPGPCECLRPCITPAPQRRTRPGTWARRRRA
jgi:hypothetical protein